MLLYPEKSTPAEVDAYTHIAAGYDVLAALPLAGVRRAVCFYAEKLRVGTVLDLGCGTGAQLAQLKDWAGRGAESTGGRKELSAWGLDASAAMLRRAQKRLCCGELPGAGGSFHLLRANMRAAPFQDKSFDLVVVSLALHENGAQAPGLLEEAARLGRHLLVMEWNMPERNLDYPGHLLAHVVERAAGSAHYASFRSFMRQGGLEGLVERHNASTSSFYLTPVYRRHFFLNMFYLMGLSVSGRLR